MAVGSIVDYLKSRGMDSSYSNRKKLAQQYGIDGYAGTAEQNTRLLSNMQSGAPQTPPSAPQNTQPSGNDNVTVIPVNNIKQESPNSRYLTDYNYTKFNPSDRTQDYADRLDELENNRPGDYHSKYDDVIDNLIDSILNRKEFDQGSVYDSDLYKNYREQYMQQGQKAMRDTIGAVTGATGGYGSSYATAVGQQAYDNYLSQLGDKTLDIYDRLYQQYLDEGQELYNRLGMVNNQDSIDYGRYRDSVNDYYNDLNYYAGRYDSSYNQDFGAYQTDLAARQWAEQYAYQKTQDALAQQNWQTQFDYQKEQDALAQKNWQAQFDYQREQDAREYALKQAAASRAKSGSSRSSKSALEPYILKARNMLNGTDGSDTHKYQSTTISRYLAKKYGLSEAEAEYVTSVASSDQREASEKTTQKYYEYAKNYAKNHEDEETAEYLNRLYENGAIDETVANDIFNRLGLRP